MRLVRLDWNSKRHNYKEAVCLFIQLNMHLCPVDINIIKLHE